MGLRRGGGGQALLLVLYLTVAAALLTRQCDARSTRPLRSTRHHLQASTSRHPSSSSQLLGAPKKLQHLVKRLDVYTSSDPYSVGSPFYMPPYEDVMDSPSPSSSPDGDPLYCINPPPTPQQPPSPGLPAPVVYPPPSPPQPSIPLYPSPPIVVPSPPEYVPGPPVSTPTPNPPEILPPSPPSYEPSPPGNVPGPVPGVPVPSPPEALPSPGVIPSPPEAVPSPPVSVPTPPSYVPTPPEYVPSPVGYVPSPPEYVPSPVGYVPSPPEYVPSPVGYVPSPPEYVPSPPGYVFQPPVVYPPPMVPPPPPPWSGTPNVLWCVAKPSVPDPIIQEAMSYACGSGADCDSIQPNGSCYQPDTLINHASYAFNSYWQRTRAAGGNCDFGGTAMLVTKDPSFDGCHFMTIAPQGGDGGE